MEKTDYMYVRKKAMTRKELEFSEVNVNAFNWLKMANVYNKRCELMHPMWLVEHADVVVLVFTIKGADKNGILEKFYTIYETAKFVNIPLEVLYIPLDDTQEEMWACYDKQANWFTLKIDDPIIPILKFMYEITCVPQLRVLSTDCAMISKDGIGDIEEYGKNAIITWLTTSSRQKQNRSFKDDCIYYGDEWKYLGIVTDMKPKDGEWKQRESVASWSEQDKADDPKSEDYHGDKHEGDEKAPEGHMGEEAEEKEIGGL